MLIKKNNLESRGWDLKYSFIVSLQYHVIIYDFISLYTNVSHRPR